MNRLFRSLFDLVSVAMRLIVTAQFWSHSKTLKRLWGDQYVAIAFSYGALIVCLWMVDIESSIYDILHWRVASIFDWIFILRIVQWFRSKSKLKFNLTLLDRRYRAVSNVWGINCFYDSNHISRPWTQLITLFKGNEFR